MSVDDFTYDQIEAYLNGEMSSQQRNAFEKELSTNETLSAQVDKHRLANDLVFENRLLSVKEIFQQTHTTATQKPSYKNHVYASIAVALAVGVAVCLFKYTRNDDTNSPSKVVSVETSTNGFSIRSIEINKSNETISSQNSLNETPEPTYLRKQDIQLIEEKNKLNVQPVETTLQNDPKLNSVSNQKVESQSDEKTSNTIHVTKELCEGVTIKADIKTSPTCLHESIGNVLIYNIHGGTKPYTISITDSNKEPSVNGALMVGIYQIHIVDSKNCDNTYSNIQITEKDCPMDYSFNPFIGEKWSIESYKSEGQLELYNKGGVLYYKMNIDANSEIEWAGVGFNNQLMPGYYIFVIKYADGTIKKGSVTVVQ